MSGGQRHAEPVDVHFILRRETTNGPQVLLSRQAGQVYAARLWHVPSGRRTPARLRAEHHDSPSPTWETC